MIVSSIRERRLVRGWSQDELARRAGLSRPAVSAIETGRVAPAVSAAISLAAALDCRVEDLFQLDSGPGRSERRWAWTPPAQPYPFWEASVGGRMILYPFERTLTGFLPPDGIARGEQREQLGFFDPQRSLVIAGCDPTVGLLAAELMRAAAIRVLALNRSSGRALDLLGQNLAHVAGLHLQNSQDRRGNEQAVRDRLGTGYTLLRVSRWEEGVALQPGVGVSSIREALRANLRWVGREEGSGARRCLDSILGRRHPEGYNRIAYDHAGVAETIRTGWAQAGVCVRLLAETTGLEFLTVQEEDYDLCFRSDLEDDPRIQALLKVVRSRPFRKLLGGLPGYDSAQSGGLQRVTE
jgi:molybdate-binding protein/DNA-binding XRE family transcriptional regulator